MQLAALRKTNIRNDHPNILVVLTDDHGRWATGCYGNPAVRSPTLDWLARTGVRMDRAFTPSPVCSPARASFFTGQMPSAHGIHDWIEEWDPVGQRHPGLRGQTTLAMRLQRAGYHTGLFGKWHCGHSREPQPGFDRWFSYADSQFPHRGRIAFSDDGRRIEHDGFQSESITREAVNYLKQRLPDERPVFAVVGYVNTHSLYRDQPERLVDRFRGHDFAEVPQEPVDLPQGKATIPWTGTAEERREKLAQYYAAVTCIDGHVGRLIDAIGAAGQLENTLIVYTADHGNMNGQHGLDSKGNATIPQNFYEESVRVPCLLRWPVVLEGGGVSDVFVDLCDLHATLLDAAGVEPAGGPGRSCLPLLRGHGGTWRDAYFGEYGNARCIRTARYKLIQRHPGPAGHWDHELYDLHDDPRETHNLAGSSAHAERIAGLSRRLDQFFAEHADAERSGLRVADLPPCNGGYEPWSVAAAERAGLEVPPLHP